MFIKRSIWTVLVAVLEWASALQSSSRNLTALYGPGLSSGAQIFYPSDPNYDEEITQRWDLYDQPTYFGAIKPATEADVQHIVRVSVQHNISFLATGRGHAVSSTLAAVNGIDIDLSDFRTVEVNAQKNQVTVGGSANFSQLYEPLYAAGKMLPLGNVRCVGVLGASLGGPVGVLQSILGLGVDYIDSLRLVTANGELVEASKKQNADLFWGMRGAGHNFGIVTSVTFNLHDVVNGGKLTNVDLLFPGSANTTIFEALKTYDDNIPNELVFNVYGIYNESSRQSSVLVNVVWFGPEDELASHIQPFLAAGPTAKDSNTVRWIDWWTVANFGAETKPGSTDCAAGQYVNACSLGIKQTDPTALTALFNSLVEFSDANPQLTAVFSVSRIPNAVTLSVSDSENVYPYRDIKSQIIVETAYRPNATLDTAATELLVKARAKLQATSGFDHLSVYVNFGRGDEGPAAWYSPEKLGRLTRLKRTWDPYERFSFYQPVPLHYP